MLVTLTGHDLALAVDSVGAQQSLRASDGPVLPIPSGFSYSGMISGVYRGAEANLPVLDATALCRFGTSG